MSGRGYLRTLYSLLIIVAGFWLLVRLFGGLDLDKSREFAVLILFGILMEWMAVDFPLGRLTGSFSVILATLLIYDFNAAVWVGAVALFIGNGISSRAGSFKTVVFNMAQQVLALYVAVAVSLFLWDREISRTSLAGAQDYLYLFGLVAIYMLVNHVLVYIYAFPGRRSVKVHNWQDTFRWDALGYLFNIPFGLIMAVLYRETGIIAAAYLFIPVLTVQFILRLYVRSEVINRELRAVYEMTRKLGSRIEYREIPVALLKEMRRAFSFHTGVVYLWDQERKQYLAAAASGPYRVQLERDYIKTGEGFLGWAAGRGEPEIIYNSKTDPRVNKDQGLVQVLRSLLVIPMEGEVGPLGLVVVGDKRPLTFNEKDLQVAITLCGTVSVSLSNRLLLDNLERHLTRDLLTGLLNRITYYQEGNQLAEIIMQEKGSLALLLFDMDILGHINEGWGVHVGDQMLAGLGQALGSINLPRSLAGRTGDDEFALLLPGHDEQGARDLARDLKDSLADYVFSKDNPLLRVKFSVGIATTPGDGATLDELTRKASRALEQAKKGGRDKIITTSDMKAMPAGKSGWLT